MKYTIPESFSTAGRALGFALALFAAAQVNAAESGKTFATPEEAVVALAGAVTTTNHKAVSIKETWAIKPRRRPKL